LLAECRTLHGCETGEAKITSGYKLPARHIIHAVGPVWHGGGQGEDEALASCYRRAMELCERHGLTSIAFPAISTGVYRFPADRAARIAVNTVIDTLPAAPIVTKVIFCCFSETVRGCIGKRWSLHPQDEGRNRHAWHYAAVTRLVQPVEPLVLM
jgi:O-acetyl-ADP-ribose deacetylase (regulator of RNase III)